jgi:hypothetical protein
MRPSRSPAYLRAGVSGGWHIRVDQKAGSFYLDESEKSRTFHNNGSFTNVPDANWGS